MHAPTPSQVPGAQVITTMQLVQMVQGGARPVIVDVLGGQQSLPGAIPAAMGGAGGSFQDGNQAQFVGLLQQATGGDTSRPVVVYCLNPQCWLSYNAALRAVNGGFTRVYWYRGGIETWSQVGLPVMASAQRPGFDTSGGNPPGGMPGSFGQGPGMQTPNIQGPGMQGPGMQAPGQFGQGGGQQPGGFGMGSPGGWNGGRPSQ
jgi:PQQ-dependent catabolism-associated CXXCW motif protein